MALSFMILLSTAAAYEEDPLGWPGVTSGYSSEFNFSSPWSDFSIFHTDNFTDFESSFATYGEYYFSTGSSIIGGMISSPVRFEIEDNQPRHIYFDGLEPVPYSQYKTLTRNANELWIEGETSWRQHVVSPQSRWLRLVANTAGGGRADFYEISQVSAEDTDLSYRQYQFYPGYNGMSFSAEKVGRHILLFVLNGQPSNAIVVDVVPAPPALVQTPPTSKPSAAFYPPQTTSAQTPPTAPSGDTTVVIQTSLTGYDVFVDGAYYGREGTDGDPLDGRYIFKVLGNQAHYIRINDGEFDYGKSIYFNRGETKIINVPPGTAVYI